MSDFGLGGYQAVASFFDKYITYSQARSMQNDMNEYNNPSHQIARMQAAGLSPWNYSGDGNTSAQPVLGDSRIAENLGSIADRSIQKRQVDAQVKLASAQEEQTRSLTETNKTLLKYLDDSERARIKNLGASTGNLIQSTEESKKRVERYNEQVDTDIALKKQIKLFSMPRLISVRLRQIGLIVCFLGKLRKLNSVFCSAMNRLQY